MKATKQCPKCQSLRVGYLETVHDQLEPDVRDNPASFSTRKVGVTERKGWVFTYATGHGGLEAYICTECGYYETYVKDPGSVPFDQLAGFHWVNAPPPPEGAYR